MKKEKKMAAALVAFTMIAVAFSVVYIDGASADRDEFTMPDVQSSTPTTYGEFNIYVGGISGATWSISSTKEGYNGAIAVNKLIQSNATLSALSIDMNYTEDMGGWYNINPEYGQISLPATIGGTQYQYLSVYYYNVDANNGQGGWALGPTGSLGFYKPFADYDLKTANIALWFTNTINGKFPGFPSTIHDLVPLTEIIDNSDFRVDFTLTADSVLVGPPRMNYPGAGPTVDSIINYFASVPMETYGYGSDAYLALKNAQGPSFIALFSGQGNVIDNNQDNNINKSYGSVQNMLGLEYGDPIGTTGVVYDNFYYWTLYYDSGYTEYAGWLLGFMSPLSEASALGSDPVALDPPWSYPTTSGTFVMDEFWMKYSYS